MDYDVAYHCRSRLTLSSGRSVTLRTLTQQMTYSGWLEGVPSRDWNDRAVAGWLDHVRAFGGHEGAALIPPARRDFLREPGDMANVRMMPGQVAEWLPVIACAGVFRDTRPARDPASDGSSLVIAWYQDEFAFPIDEAALRSIREIDWDRLATDDYF